MADLSVDYAGLTLKNPLVSGASSLGNHIDKLRRLEEAGIGAVTTKVINSPRHGPERDSPYRCVMQKRNWLLMGDPNLPHEYGLALVKAAKRHLKIPVIAHFVGIGADVDSWLDNAKALEAAGADALEMDLYCPLPPPDRGQEASSEVGHGAASLGAHAKELGEVIRALVDAVKIPVIPKLNPSITSLVNVASICVQSGASTLVMGNIIDGHPGVDIHRGGSSLLPKAVPPLGMPYLGSYLFPLHNKLLLVLKHAFGNRVSVISGGGISTWEGVVQRTMLGANAVQICSALIVEGLRIIGSWLEGLEKYLERYDYQRLDDFRGIAVPNSVQGAHGEISPAVARIKDPTRCQRCADKCVEKVSADCLAMRMGADGIPVIDEAKCTGCAWCLWHCGSSAIDLVLTDQFVDVCKIESSLGRHP